MNEEKVRTIIKMFDGNNIRTKWDAEKGEYYFSIVNVIEALTESRKPRDYWYKLKNRMSEEEKAELSTICRRLKFRSKDGKMRATDSFDMEGIFRIIQSIPSPKAEPFKLWLAKLGKEEIDNVFDPSVAITKSIDYYKKKGYSNEWIEKRIIAIINRTKLTNAWRYAGVKNNLEYAILTNDIYRQWSGMSAKEYKKYKKIRKESLRDNMSDLEIALTDLSEVATREFIKSKRPQGFNENRIYAIKGGNVAKVAKENIEEELGTKVISSRNNLGYQYTDKLD